MNICSYNKFSEPFDFCISSDCSIYKLFIIMIVIYFRVKSRLCYQMSVSITCRGGPLSILYPMGWPVLHFLPAGSGETYIIKDRSIGKEYVRFVTSDSVNERDRKAALQFSFNKPI